MCCRLSPFNSPNSVTCHLDKYTYGHLFVGKGNLPTSNDLQYCLSKPEISAIGRYQLMSVVLSSELSALCKEVRQRGISANRKVYSSSEHWGLTSNHANLFTIAGEDSLHLAVSMQSPATEMSGDRYR